MFPFLPRARSRRRRDRRARRRAWSGRHTGEQAAARRATRTSGSSSITTSRSTRSRPRARQRPARAANFRTPRFDLDSLYGSGPADQPFLYDWSREADPRRRSCSSGATRTRRDLRRIDLPRNAQGRALIGDPRNDENLIVSQLHLLFIRFHNAVVERVLGQAPASGGRRAVRRGAADRALALPVDRRPRLPRADRRPRHARPCGRAPTAARRPSSAGFFALARRAGHAGRVLGRRVPLRAQHGPRRTTTSRAAQSRRDLPVPGGEGARDLTGFRRPPGRPRDRLGPVLLRGVDLRGGTTACGSTRSWPGRRPSAAAPRDAELALLNLRAAGPRAARGTRRRPSDGRSSRSSDDELAPLGASRRRSRSGFAR